MVGAVVVECVPGTLANVIRTRLDQSQNALSDVNSTSHAVSVPHKASTTCPQSLEDL